MSEAVSRSTLASSDSNKDLSDHPFIQGATDSSLSDVSNGCKSLMEGQLSQCLYNTLYLSFRTALLWRDLSFTAAIPAFHLLQYDVDRIGLNQIEQFLEFDISSRPMHEY